MGYAFCQMQEQPFSTNMVPFKSLFIDDLCVDQQARGQHIGGNGILNGRLIHLYRLETTLQSSIFFDIFTVLI